VNFTAGFLSDIYGRRKLLIASGVVFATAPLIYPFTTQATTLALARAYHGLATAVFVPVSLAYIADIYPRAKGTMMGFFSTSTLIGRMIAPATAGLIIYTWSYSAAFMVCSAVGTAALLTIILIPPSVELRAKVSKQEIEKEISRQEKLENLPLLIVIGVIEASLYYSMQSIETFLPLYNPEFKVTEWLPGLILSLQIAAIALTKPLSGYLSDVLGRGKMVVAGVLIAFFGIVLLSQSIDVTFIAISAIIFAAGLAISTSATKPMAAELLGKSFRGTAIGALESLKDVGQALGPIASGIIASKLGIGASFIYAAIILASILALFVLVYVLLGRV
jgi:MFS family permease